ncbi:MAG: thiamine-phosphate kinase [Candidatus Micrarchaeaceae archaeon]
MEIGKMGERKIISLIRSLYSYKWPDSDAAYVDFGKRRILITTDSITRYAHIPNCAMPEDVGYFFAAINLSDIAAMGGTPKYFMSSFILPSSLDSSYLISLEAGIKKCLDKYHVKLIGGDLKKGKELSMTGIAIGEVPRSQMMHRLRMRNGDALCVTGSLGGNAAGYYLWKRGSKEGAKKMLDVDPRINEGKFLSKNGVKAAIDLSDGVYSAISQLKDATGLGFEICYDNIPVDPLARKLNLKYGIRIEQMCLNFGGDYELLFSVSESRLNALMKNAKRKGFKITRIGIVTGADNFLVKGAKRVKITKHGYEHFITD